MRAPLKFELDRRQGVLNIGYGAGSSPTFTNLTVTGVALFANGTAAAPSISFAADTDTGIYRYATNSIGFATGGANRFFMSGSQFGGVTGQNIDMPAAGSIALVASGTNQNITLTPSGTGGVIVANTNANTARLYIQTTDSLLSNGILAFQGSAGTSLLSFGTRQNITGSQGFEWLVGSTTVAAILNNGRMLLGTTTDSGALLQIGANAATGAALAGMSFGGDLFLLRASTSTLTFNSAISSAIFSVGSTGTTLNIQAQSSTCSISANAPLSFNSSGVLALTLDASQNATFAGDVATANAKAFYWGTRSVMTSPSDGVIRLANSAGTDFTRLQFGGTTASFPAIKRTGAQFDLLLADESDFTTVRLANVRAVRAAATASAGEVAYGGTTATTVGAAGGASLLPATPLGYIIVNVAGTAAKIPYYNS